MQDTQQAIPEPKFKTGQTVLVDGSATGLGHQVCVIFNEPDFNTVSCIYYYELKLVEPCNGMTSLSCAEHFLSLIEKE